MVNCKHCNKEFKQRFGREVFCSRSCWIEHRRDKMIKVTCEQCGKEFTRIKSKIRDTKNFCSNECYVNSRKIHKYEERICEYCGETYTIYSKYKNRYCSVDCSNKHRAELKKEREFYELLQNV